MNEQYSEFCDSAIIEMHYNKTTYYIIDTVLAKLSNIVVSGSHGVLYLYEDEFSQVREARMTKKVMRAFSENYIGMNDVSSFRKTIIDLTDNTNTGLLVTFAVLLGCNEEFIRTTKLTEFLPLFEALGFDDSASTPVSHALELGTLMREAYADRALIPYIRAGFTDTSVIESLIADGVDAEIAASARNGAV